MVRIFALFFFSWVAFFDSCWMLMEVSELSFFFVRAFRPTGFPRIEVFSFYLFPCLSPPQRGSLNPLPPPWSPGAPPFFSISLIFFFFPFFFWPHPRPRMKGKTPLGLPAVEQDFFLFCGTQPRPLVMSLDLVASLGTFFGYFGIRIVQGIPARQNK